MALHFHLYCIKPNCNDDVAVFEEVMLSLFIDFHVHTAARACIDPRCAPQEKGTEK